MKTKILFTVFAFVMALNAYAQRGSRIAYVDMEYILENVEEYQEASKQLEAKAAKWKIEIETKQQQIDALKKELNAEKVLLTKELVEEREEEIQAQEKEMIAYQQDRFGPQGDLVQQKKMLIRPVQDQVFNAVKDLGVNKKYDIIFDKSDVVMLFSNNRHDISDQVLRLIGRAKKLKNNKGKKEKSSLDKYTEPENEAVKARKEEKSAKAKSRAEQAEEMRKKKLADREARKKAYEERRKKLLADREAKRKAKESKRSKETENKKEEENKNNSPDN